MVSWRTFIYIEGRISNSLMIVGKDRMAASPALVEPAPLIRPLLVQDNVNIDERRLKVSGLLEQVFLW